MSSLTNATLTNRKHGDQADPARARRRRLRAAAALAAAALGLAALTAQAQVPPTTAPAAPAAPAVAPAPLAPAAAPAAAPATQPAAARQQQHVISLDDLGPNDKVHVLVGRTVVLKSKNRLPGVSFSQPDVATDTIIDPNTILLTAKRIGVTQLTLLEDGGRARQIDVVVDIDLDALDQQLKRLFPGAKIEVTNANGTIVLRGRVPNLQVAEQATELVASYGKAMNFLELAGGQQVILKVRFAEVSRSASNQLGFNVFATDGRFQGGYVRNPGVNPIGSVATGAAADATINPAVSVFGGGRVGQTALEAFVQALRTNNLLRVLAEPNLTAMSGQEASFLAGGEFPIPVPQAGGGATAITVEYKQFGVRLNFLPVVLGDGKIRLKCSPEVSDLDFSRSVSFNGFTIPSLTKRNLTTTIELNEGQTFAVGGLLNQRVNAATDVVPLIGDVPILGALFRSVRYDRSETELVILVTPELVEGMNPGQVPTLPGEHWSFPTENDMLFKRYLGGPSADAAAPAAPERPGPARFRGPYGFTPTGK